MYCTPYHIELIDKKYPGWRDKSQKVYNSIGENNDMEYLQMIENSLALIIPYKHIAIGATRGGHEDMLLHALHKGYSTFVSYMGFHLTLIAKEYRNEHLYDAIICYYGDDVFENKF